MPTYHFNMRTSKQCTEYLERSEHLTALIQLQHLNLHIGFISSTKHYAQKLGTFHVLLIRTILDKI